MTKGNIPNHLINFSIPLILGNLFQLTYNAVDSIVLGRFAGVDALAAVGTANPIMSIMILGITGLCIGASVLMSEYFGAENSVKLKKTFATTLIAGTLFSVFVAVAGAVLSGLMLKAMQVPAEIFSQSRIYLQIIFLAMPFTYLYNAYAAAMRSVGDAKTPIRFLAMASILNGCLDIIFIVFLHWDVIGAGMATLLAEAFSALMCILYVYKKLPLLQLFRKDIVLDKDILKCTIENASVTALQQSCQPIGKLMIQGVINPLGVDVIAAFNAVNRVDDFAFTPQQSVSSSIMTLVAQNRGAKKSNRIKKGFFDGLLVEAGYWILICSAILLLREPIMRLFVGDTAPNMVKAGVDYLTLMAFFYLMPSFTNGVQGFFRGMGDMKITLICTCIQITVRFIFVYLLVPRIGLSGVAYASLIGWFFMLLAEIPYYFYRDKAMFSKLAN